MFRLTNIKALQLFQLIRQATIILVSILLTKSVLSAENIGAYELVFYIGSSITFFWVAGFLQGLLAYFPELEKKDQRHLVWNSYLIFVGISMLLCLGLKLGSGPLFALLGQAEPVFFQHYIYYLLVSTPCFLLEYIFLLYNKPKQIVAWAIFSFGTFLLAVILPVFLGYELLVSFQCLLALAVFRHVCTLLTVWKYGERKLRIDLVKPFFWLSLPLVAYAFIGAFGFIFDKWLISWYYQSERIFAVFSYGAKELPLATALSAAFSNAMVPVLVTDLNKGLLDLKVKARKLQWLIFPVGIVLLLTSKYWFPIVFNPDFTDSVIIFNIYLLIIISRLLFPQTILIALKETKFMLVISLLEILINIVLSFLFIPSFGLAGVAMATFIAYLFEKLVFTFFLYKKHNIKLGDYTDTKLFYAFSLIMSLVFVGTLFL